MKPDAVHWWILPFLFLGMPGFLPGQSAGAEKSQESSFVSLVLQPALTIPVGRDADAFGLGGAASLLAELSVPTFPLLSLDLGVGYSMSPVRLASDESGDPVYMSIIEPKAGVVVSWPLLPRLRMNAHLHGGYYIAFLLGSPGSEPGYNPLLTAGAGLSYELFSALRLGLGVDYRLFFGLYNDLAIAFGTSYHFPRSKGSAPGILPSRLKPYKALKLSELSFEPVFPVFFKYFASHPVGKLVIRNEGKIPLEDLKVSIFVNQYMDNPKAILEIPFLKGGASQQVDLFALFNERVLDIKESTLVQVNLTVELTAAGESYGNELVETLRIYDRNAVTWTDDRRAAAFVTMKDPAVLRFSKNVMSMVKEKAGRAFPANLLAALALHQALRLYGMIYAVDPTTPYQELSQQKLSVDYLQFPNQSLEYKAGDCDDLSILYSALLESLGIETAFITIPGHIYLAFSLGISAAEAQEQFLRIEDLILRDERIWVPVEITELRGGFLKAWQTGAKQWRENSAAGQAVLYPVHDAWSIYEPVGYAGKYEALDLPKEMELVDAVARELDRLLEIELYPRVEKLENQIRESRGDPIFINKLGVVYARYGQHEKAAKEFRRALAQKEYLPAMVNLGNILLLVNDAAQALGYYERAYKLEPDNPAVLLGLSRANYELSRYPLVDRYYSRLLKQNKELAQKYAYLDLKSGDASSRATAAAGAREDMVWLP